MSVEKIKPADIVQAVLQGPWSEGIHQIYHRLKGTLKGEYYRKAVVTAVRTRMQSVRGAEAEAIREITSAALSAHPLAAGSMISWHVRMQCRHAAWVSAHASIAEIIRLTMEWALQCDMLDVSDPKWGMIRDVDQDMAEACPANVVPMDAV